MIWEPREKWTGGGIENPRRMEMEIALRCWFLGSCGCLRCRAGARMHALEILGAEARPCFRGFFQNRSNDEEVVLFDNHDRSFTRET